MPGFCRRFPAPSSWRRSTPTRRGPTGSPPRTAPPPRSNSRIFPATARPAFDYGDLLGKVDAVTVAVPTELHRDVALAFLSSGVPVLVEKPLARSLAEADAMIGAAAKSRAHLAVGHTERFNPAVAAAR